MRSLIFAAIPATLLTCGVAVLGQDVVPDVRVAEVQTDNPVPDEQPWPWPEVAGVTPEPGRYRTKMTLVSFESAAFDGIDGFDMAALMRESLPEAFEFCVRGDEPPVDVIHGFLEEDCTETQVTADSGRYSVTAQCVQDSGIANTVQIDGLVSETRARTDLRFAAELEGAGPMAIQMRALTRRIGEC